MKQFFVRIKTSVLAVVLLAVAAMANAQSSGFTYQAVVRDANGNLVENANVGLRLTLTDQSGVPVMYQETLSATTNSYGVLSVLVGSQDTVAMNRVDWSRGVWMHVEVDPRGGTNYIDLGLTKLQAVPYAFYAAARPQPLRARANSPAPHPTAPRTLRIFCGAVSPSDGNNFPITDLEKSYLCESKNQRIIKTKQSQ